MQFEKAKRVSFFRSTGVRCLGGTWGESSQTSSTAVTRAPTFAEAASHGLPNQKSSRETAIENALFSDEWGRKQVLVSSLVFFSWPRCRPKGENACNQSLGHRMAD